METEIITPNEELRQMIKDGYFFGFCVASALNKGFRDAIKEKKEVVFMVGDYEVKFVPDQLHFELCHKIYFARIIHADYHGATFIGDDEEEVIAELLAEFDKEISNP
jgi:hypothetical protein